MSNVSSHTDEWAPPPLDIPPHWKQIDFEDAFENISLSRLKVPQKEYLSSGTIPIIDQGANLIGGYTNDASKSIQSTRALIVFGDHTKCFKLVGFRFAPGADGVKVLKPITIDERFAYYACKALRLPDRGYSRHYAFLKKSKIPLAPQNEQHRIVAKIEELFSELAKGVESLKTVREQLNVYRQAVLKHAFEGKLTAQWREENSATPWTQTTLGSQLSFLTSGSRGWAKFYAEHGDKFIRAQNLKYDRLDLADMAFVDLPDKSEGMRTRVQIGDLLITITGANVTKTAFVTSDIGTAYVSQHVALARPVEGSNTEFLYWYLVSEAAGRKQLTASAYGAGKPGLNLENIRSVDIPLPSAEEQTEIVSRINTILSIERSVSAQIDIQLARSDALRQSILKKAFSGQLVAQDPHDELASVLLDRIRAEREKAMKNNHSKKMKKRKTAA